MTRIPFSVKLPGAKHNIGTWQPDYQPAANADSKHHRGDTPKIRWFDLLKIKDDHPSCNSQQGCDHHTLDVDIIRSQEYRYVDEYLDGKPH